MTAAGIAAGVDDTITILRARGRRLSKLICCDGTIEDYDSTRHFDLLTVPIAGLNELAYLLRNLATRRDCAVVRGAIADPARTRDVRRLVHPDQKTEDAPTLRDVPKRWLALDIDRLPLPGGTEARDLWECARIAIAELPTPFQSARCIVQATASHGIAPSVHLQLWYWLSRPTSGGELRRWLRAKPVDHSVFGAAQLIYTATPLFADGARDPLIERIAALPGMIEAVAVPPASALTPPRKPMAAIISKTARTGRYGFAALVCATARVARATAGTRHATLLAEACRLRRLVESGALTPRDVTAALSGAAGIAGLDDCEAAAVIGWALVHSAGVKA